MWDLLGRLLPEDDGQDLVEYALLSALLAVACITAMLGLTQVREFFAAIGAFLDTAAT